MPAAVVELLEVVDVDHQTGGKDLFRLLRQIFFHRMLQIGRLYAPVRASVRDFCSSSRSELMSTTLPTARMGRRPGHR